MSDHLLENQKLDVEVLRQAIQEEYADEWLIGIPESSIEPIAGNPFSLDA